MFTVTERAAQELNVIKAQHVSEPNQALRLASGPTGQLALVPDEQKEDDHKVEHEGMTVLLVGSEIADLLSEATLDCVDTPEGARLVLKTEEGPDA